MPVLGADMEAGTLVEWLKKPGDQVRRGDVIAEVETDKADIEVEVFLNGVIERILVEPGEKVPVGTPLAIIREEGAIPAPGRAQQTPEVAPGQPPPTPSPVPGPVAAGAPVTPAARALARELGVDVTSLRGTGPDGRIQRRDVVEAAARLRQAPPPAVVAPPASAAAPGPPAPTPPAADRQARMRQAISAAMTRSAREIPHFHVSSTIDMARPIAWLREENANRPIADRVLYGALLLKAVAMALRDVPELNAVWSGDRAERRGMIHVGVAISLRGGGLVAPAIHDTAEKNLVELMRDFRDLVQRARAGSLRSSEIADPTITVTSLGETGAEAVYGLIYPPQVALVGFGRLADRVVAVDGAIAVHPTITATLSADHRVIDGHRASVYLAALDRLLQEPEQL